MAQLRMLVELTDHPNVRGMYDTHHANMEEKTFPEAIRTIAPVLKHVHLSENDRGTPGSGHINFRENLIALRLNNTQMRAVKAFAKQHNASVSEVIRISIEMMIPEAKR